MYNITTKTPILITIEQQGGCQKISITTPI